MNLEGETRKMFLVEEVATMFGLKKATIQGRIRRGELPAEPIMGNKQNGYLIPGDGLAARLRELGLEGQARMVEEAMVSGKIEPLS